jgi:hypothetical protein
MIGDSIPKLKLKGAQMTKVLTASVVLALLFSLTAIAHNNEIAKGANTLEPLHWDLEIQLALRSRLIS